MKSRNQSSASILLPHVYSIARVAVFISAYASTMTDVPKEHNGLPKWFGGTCT